MGWVSLLEDACKRFDSETFRSLRRDNLKDRGVPSPRAREITDKARAREILEANARERGARELASIIHRLKNELYECLEVLTAPGSPISDFDLAEIKQLVLDNRKLATEITATKDRNRQLEAEIQRLKQIHELRSAEFREELKRYELAAEDLVFLRAMNSGSEKQKKRNGARGSGRHGR